MPLMPAFEIGVWNAWIFMLYHFLPTPVVMLIHKGVAQEMEKPHSEIERRLYPAAWAVWILCVIYSIFLPLRLGTMWFYVGFPIAMIGVIAHTAVTVSFVTTPIATEPITKGIYRYSRHPMYIAQLVMLIGVGIACASWLFLLLSIVYSALSIVFVIPEERRCLEKYGNAYREYMSKTPRWIGMPKSSMRRRTS
jgi:protein-S-isoprenylcysteine O-methyltransferase Ste14